MSIEKIRPAAKRLAASASRSAMRKLLALPYGRRYPRKARLLPQSQRRCHRLWGRIFSSSW
ncbi:MAG: hypothetical protein IJW46_01890 [Clostridia bacterium]|nr:hypothetical protein [Clostridia bacterium]